MKSKEVKMKPTMIYYLYCRLAKNGKAGKIPGVGEDVWRPEQRGWWECSLAHSNVGGEQGMHTPLLVIYPRET